MHQSIKQLIEEYFDMEDGEYIKDYLNEVIFFGDDVEIRMKYKALKHIVEQRKKDKYSIEKIFSIFEILVHVLKTNNYVITHNKITNEYILIEKFTQDVKSIFIALEITLIKPNTYYIKTGFYRLLTKIKTTYL